MKERQSYDVSPLRHNLPLVVSTASLGKCSLTPIANWLYPLVSDANKANETHRPRKPTFFCRGHPCKSSNFHRQQLCVDWKLSIGEHATMKVSFLPRYSFQPNALMIDPRTPIGRTHERRSPDLSQLAPSAPTKTSSWRLRWSRSPRSVHSRQRSMLLLLFPLEYRLKKTIPDANLRQFHRS